MTPALKPEIEAIAIVRYFITIVWYSDWQARK